MADRKLDKDEALATLNGRKAIESDPKVNEAYGVLAANLEEIYQRNQALVIDTEDRKINLGALNANLLSEPVKAALKVLKDNGQTSGELSTAPVEKTFLEKATDIASENRVGIGTGVVGLLLGMLAFDLGPITSLLLAAGAFAVGNAFGDKDHGLFSGLFKKEEQPQRDGAERTRELVRDGKIDEAQRLALLAANPVITPIDATSFKYTSVENGKEFSAIISGEATSNQFKVTKVVMADDKEEKNILRQYFEINSDISSDIAKDLQSKIKPNVTIPGTPEVLGLPVPEAVRRQNEATRTTRN